MNARNKCILCMLYAEEVVSHFIYIYIIKTKQNDINHKKTFTDRDRDRLNIRSNLMFNY